MSRKPQTPEEVELLKLYERGRLLSTVTSDPGWKEVLRTLDRLVDEADYHLFNYSGSDKDAIAALHRRARSYREFRQLFLSTIQQAVEASRGLPTREGVGGIAGLE